MKFDDMNAMQRRLHNAAIVLDGDGDEYGFTGLLREAIGKLEQLRADAARYRWLRDEAVRFAPASKRGEMVWCVIGKNAMECSPCESDELDAAIDAAIDAAMLKTPNVQAKGPARSDGPA